MDKGFIICVDDEESVVSTLKEQLAKYFGHTHEIEVATSGNEAWEIIQEIISEGGSVEVVITDQVMPGLKGDELLEKVNQISPDTIKILLTGQAGLQDTIDAINKGGLNYFIEKPWNIEELHVHIERLIQKYKENVENHRLIKQLESRVKELENLLQEKEDAEP
ncbi:MAG: response regulator [Leptospiraceae bacterium]|jgi:two-component system chemotaxis response regulator CheY|nr:response regulator [Leptospiraceae bacterium]